MPIIIPTSNIFSDGCIYMCVNYDIRSRLDYKFGCKSLTDNNQFFFLPFSICSLPGVKFTGLNLLLFTGHRSKMEGH